MDTVNKLIYETTKTKKGLDYLITIKLADESKNGHNDFSITGTIYPSGKRGDRNMITAGAIGEEIAKQFPEFKIFDELHLADVTGAPMYAIANGFYHLSEGFNNTKPNHPNFKAEYCAYYRIDEKQFDVLSTSEDESIFAYHLSKLGIVTQWKKQANEAISLLEKLTGENFKDDSTTLHKVELEPAELKRIDLKIKNGHYAPINIKKRVDEKEAAEKQKLFDDIKKDLNAAIKKETIEYNVKFAVLTFDLSLKNFIYYDHINEGVFNWLDYERKITQEQFDNFVKWLYKNEKDPTNGREFKAPLENLPIGITFKLK